MSVQSALIFGIIFFTAIFQVVLYEPDFADNNR